MSVGGWTGSLYYSANVASAENRTAFVKTITDFATKYELDGIDFEYVIICLRALRTVSDSPLFHRQLGISRQPGHRM